MHRNCLIMPVLDPDMGATVSAGALLGPLLALQAQRQDDSICACFGRCPPFTRRPAVCRRGLHRRRAVGCAAPLSPRLRRPRGRPTAAGTRAGVARPRAVGPWRATANSGSGRRVAGPAPPIYGRTAGTWQLARIPHASGRTETSAARAAPAPGGSRHVARSKRAGAQHGPSAAPSPWPPSATSPHRRQRAPAPGAADRRVGVHSLQGPHVAEVLWVVRIAIPAVEGSGSPRVARGECQTASSTWSWGGSALLVASFVRRSSFFRLRCETFPSEGAVWNIDWLGNTPSMQTRMKPQLSMR